jgi:putative superfamily III holin-X
MTSTTPPTRPGKRRRQVDVPSPADPTVGKLFVDASRDLSSLVRNEIALAKTELKVSIRAGGTGLGLFAAAAFLALLAIIMLSVALAYFVSMTGLHLAWSFLIVFAVYLLVAGVLGFVGVRKVKKVRAPQRAIHQAQEASSLLKRS